MSYFDTIRCHHCRAQIDPDSIGGREGFACPHCGGELKASDLFGLSDAFLGHDEDEGNDMSLEALMGKVATPGMDLQPDNPQPSARAAHAERATNPSGKPIGALELMREMKNKK